MPCDCAEKWEENKREHDEFKRRLEKLESSGEGSSDINPGSGSHNGSQPGTDVESRLAEMEKKIAELEQKITDLQKGACSCVAQVQEAIDKALSGAPASLGGSSSSEVQGNANGTITVTTSWSY